MKTNMFKGVLTAASVLLAVASASSAIADSRSASSEKFFTGAQLLGFSSAATDLWIALCPAGTLGLRADILDRFPVNNAAAKMHVTIVKDNGATGITTPGLDNSLAGPVQLNKGSGAYTVVFGKTAAGSEDYDSIINCVNGAGGSFNPTATLLIQNQ